MYYKGFFSIKLLISDSLLKNTPTGILLKKLDDSLLHLSVCVRCLRICLKTASRRKMSIESERSAGFFLRIFAFIRSFALPETHAMMC